ncbi:MAG: LytTR family transcriptional regulator [Bacteroidales bacterium]|nr:LytTR family transcriptional regulator [Bacteroidales bacterium]
MKNLEVFINPASNCNAIYIIARNGHKVIDLDKIILCKADRNYTKILHTDCGAQIILPKSLCVIESVLKDYHFLRCSSSYIINLNRPGSFNRYLRIIYLAGHNISVPRKRCSKVFPILTAFGFREELRRFG